MAENHARAGYIGGRNKWRDIPKEKRSEMMRKVALARWKNKQASKV